MITADMESALLYLGWEQDRVVYFSIPDCSPEEATKIRKSMGVSLWLDGFVYKDVPNGLGAFAVLATSQQVDLKSQAGEHAYCCLLPCWRRDDLFALGRTVFRYDALEMKDRFFYSGGSVRDFSALTVDDIEDVITHAVRKVNDPENLLSSAGFVSPGDGQVDRLRHTFLNNDVEEGVNPRDKFRREKYWEQVVDSELAVALLSMRMRSDALYRIFQWARRSNYASLAGCVFEMYTHYLAGDSMLKSTTLHLVIPSISSRCLCTKVSRTALKDDYVKALINRMERCKGEELLGAKGPAVSQHRQHRQTGTKERGVQTKLDFLDDHRSLGREVRRRVSPDHYCTIKSQSLVELNKIFKAPVSSTPGNTERDHPMEAVETETASGRNGESSDGRQRSSSPHGHG